MSKKGACQLFVLSDRAAKGVLQFGNMKFPCAIGRAGISYRKREGDGATPAGALRVVEVCYRPDRVRRPFAVFPVQPLRRSDGWCDDRNDRNYNRKVRMPYPASAEELWRADHLYDLVVVLDYNIRPRAKGRGSAIFLHVASPGLGPTAGCVALKREHLPRLLAALPVGAAILAGKNLPKRQRGRRGLR